MQKSISKVYKVLLKDNSMEIESTARSHPMGSRMAQQPPLAPILCRLQLSLNTAVSGLQKALHRTYKQQQKYAQIFTTTTLQRSEFVLTVRQMLTNYASQDRSEEKK